MIAAARQRWYKTRSREAEVAEGGIGERGRRSAQVRVDISGEGRL
jgi:hypothetical protein